MADAMTDRIWCTYSMSHPSSSSESPGSNFCATMSCSSGATCPTTSKESIHSGHFMVSNFERASEDEEAESLNVPILNEDSDPENKSIMGDLMLQQSPESVAAVHKVSIDSSLTKLFHALTIAYNQEITNPRWNMFKGMRLNMKDKIRLNNVIWRCWYMQFVRRRTLSVCRFSSSYDEEHHKPLSVVLEGKYWKRKPEAITAEYKKWRTFCKHRVERQRGGDGNSCVSDTGRVDWCDQHRVGAGEADADELFMNFGDDSLMELLMQQPYTFPNPREMARVGVADLIQPGLLELQPDLNDMDWMNSMEPLHGLINNRLTPLVEEPAVTLATTLSSTSYRPVDSTAVEAASCNMDALANVQTRECISTAVLPDVETIETAMESIDVKPAPAPSFQAAQFPPPPSVPLFIPPTCASTTASLQQSGKKLLTADSCPVPASAESSTIVPAVSNITMRPPAQVATLATLGSAGRARTVSLNSARASGVQPILPAPPSLKSAVTAPSAGLSRRSSMTDMQLARASGAMARSASDSSGVRSMILRCSFGQSSGDRAPSSGNRPLMLTKLLTAGSSRDSTGACANVTDSGSLLTHSSSPSSALSLQSPSSSLPAPTLPIQQPVLTSRAGVRDVRRAYHSTSEQKRRGTIRGGFERLHSLIPSLRGEKNAKISKAALLHKGAEYIGELKSERTKLQSELSTLRRSIESLNQEIYHCQSLLPATGAPVTCARQSKVQQMFEDYVRERTLVDWRFYLFAQLMSPLADSYAAAVSTSCHAELKRTVLTWQEQNCALTQLRPHAIRALCQLSRNTSVLRHPQWLPAESVNAVCRLGGASSVSAGVEVSTAVDRGDPV